MKNKLLLWNVLFVTSLVISNVLSGKLVMIGQFTDKRIKVTILTIILKIVVLFL